MLRKYEDEFRSFAERLVSVTSRYIKIREETKTEKGKVSISLYVFRQLNFNLHVNILNSRLYIDEIYFQRSKKYYKLSLFNAEVRVEKPMSNKLKLNGATIEMRMNIKPSTTASQKSSKSSYIEMSFNANVDHYLCYQWTRAIEVHTNYHNAESGINEINNRFFYIYIYIDETPI